ncbi:hypothetical protein Tcan_05735 [Toxocara canis]|uniref:Uncharacterized protein n=1 Tax=Toxocara canis TaxID=6265 RepID=A0A0B2W4V0_TOXCA|nr:hypothetical protein Tcan_05735 [Toxocara canis]
MISFCNSFHCCGRKVKKDELEEPYGVISATDSSTACDKNLSHVSFRLPNASGTHNRERLSQPTFSQSGTHGQHASQRSSVPPVRPHSSTKRALPKLPELEKGASNAMYSSIERPSSRARHRSRSPSYIEEGVNPMYESIDAESDSISDPLYSRVESESASARKYDYPVFNGLRTARGPSAEEAVYQSASQIYAAASEDPYSSITSQTGGDMNYGLRIARMKGQTETSDSAHSGVKPSTSKDIEDLYTKIRRGTPGDGTFKVPNGGDQSESLPGTSYASGGSQLTGYASSGSEKTSREPSYRYITVRESVDVIRRRLNERELLEANGAASTAGSADGSLPVREHYYSSIGGGSDYESMSVAALYERIPDLTTSSVGNDEEQTLTGEAASSFGRSMNASAEMSSACARVTSTADYGGVAPKPPTSPIPNRLSSEAVDMASFRHSMVGEQIPFIEGGSPPYASIQNDIRSPSNNAVVGSSSSDVRPSIKPIVVMSDSSVMSSKKRLGSSLSDASNKVNPRKRPTSNFFETKLVDTSASGERDVIAPVQEQSKSSTVISAASETVGSDEKSRLRVERPASGSMSRTFAKTLDEEECVQSTKSGTNDVGLPGMDSGRQKGTKIIRKCLAENSSLYGNQRNSVVGTNCHTVSHATYFTKGTSVLPSAPYRSANRSPISVLACENEENGQKCGRGMSSGDSTVTHTNAVASTELLLDFQNIARYPSEAVVEAKTAEKKEPTIKVEQNLCKRSEAVEEPKADTSERIVPIEMVSSRFVTTVPSLHIRPSENSLLVDSIPSSQTFHSQAETYVAGQLTSASARSAPIEIGTKSTDTSDFDSGVMSRSLDSTGSQTDDLYDGWIGRSSSKSVIPVLRNSRRVRQKSIGQKERHHKGSVEREESDVRTNVAETPRAPASACLTLGVSRSELGNLKGHDYVSPVDLGTERSWPLTSSYGWIGRSSSKSVIPVLRNSRRVRQKSIGQKERHHKGSVEREESDVRTNVAETPRAPASACLTLGVSRSELGNLKGHDYVSPVDLGTERSWPLTSSSSESPKLVSDICRSKTFSNSVMAPPNPEAIFQPLRPGEMVDVVPLPNVSVHI